jgi:hypothetical protein
VDDGRTVQRHMAVGYERKDGGLVRALREEPSNRVAAGDLLGTTEDLFRFERVLTHAVDRVLSADSKELLYQIQDDPFYAYAGMTLKVPYENRPDTLTLVSVGGSSYGFDVRADRLVEEDGALIGMTNIQGDGELLNAIFEDIGDDLLEYLGVRSPGKKER